MKRIVLGMSLLMLLGVFQANAQGFTFGVKAGVNAGTPIGPAPDSASGAPGVGPHVGVFARLNLKDRLDIQPELMYSYKSGTFYTPIEGDTVYEQTLAGQTFLLPTYYEGDVDGSFSLHYIELPINVMYHFGDHWSIHGGPYFGYLILGKNEGTASGVVGNNFSTFENEPFDQSAELNPLDYGAVLGGNYETYTGWNFSLRATCGLRSVYKDSYTMPPGTIRNVYLQASIGYRFGVEPPVTE